MSASSTPRLCTLGAAIWMLCLGVGVLLVDTASASFSHAPIASGGADQVSECSFCHRAPVESLGPSTDHTRESSLQEASASSNCVSCHDGLRAREVPISLIGNASAGRGRTAGPGYVGHPVGFALFDVMDRDAIPALVSEGDGTRTVWWIDTEHVPNGRLDPTDIRLFARASAGGDQPHFECASCHDPHGSPQRNTLRRSNAGDALCRPCH